MAFNSIDNHHLRGREASEPLQSQTIIQRLPLPVYPQQSDWIHPSHQRSPIHTFARRETLYRWAERVCSLLALLVGMALLTGSMPLTVINALLLFMLVVTPPLLHWDLARRKRDLIQRSFSSSFS